MTLENELDRVEAELAAARVEHARLGAKIDGLKAERDALAEAVRSIPSAAATSVTDDLSGMTKKQAIVAILTRAGQPMRIGEIVKAFHAAGRTGDNYSGISVYLDTMLKEGKVRRVERGLYTAEVH
jgi:hypothetical protein